MAVDFATDSFRSTDLLMMISDDYLNETVYERSPLEIKL